MSAAVGFLLGTQEQVRNSRDKRAISVRATEVLLHIDSTGPGQKSLDKIEIPTSIAICFFVSKGTPCRSLTPQVPETEIAAFAKSVVLDVVAHNEPPHLDLHWLPSSL